MGQEGGRLGPRSKTPRSLKGRSASESEHKGTGPRRGGGGGGGGGGGRILPGRKITIE